MTEETEKQIETIKKGFASSYRECFSTDAGRMVLMDLMHYCKFLQDNFHADARAEAYLLGMRRMFLRCLSLSQQNVGELIQRDPLGKLQGLEDE